MAEDQWQGLRNVIYPVAAGRKVSLGTGSLSAVDLETPVLEKVGISLKENKLKVLESLILAKIKFAFW